MAEVIFVEEKHTSEETGYPHRQSRQKQCPDTVQYMVVCDSVRSEPMTLKEALESNKCQHWSSAIQGVFDSLKRNQTWTLVKLPEGKRVIDCKWAFKIKQV
jgi:hypothetical protein